MSVFRFTLTEKDPLRSCLFFSKAELGMSLRSFAKNMGLPNGLNFDRAVEQMGQKSNFQCEIQELCTQWRTSVPCPP